MSSSAASLCAWLLLVAIAPPAAAQDAEGGDRLLNLKTGNLRVEPSLSVQERYDSNIFLVDTDATEDWITIVSPRLDAEYRTDKLQGAVSYLAQSLFFHDHDEEDFVQHYVNGGFRFMPGVVFVGTGGSFQLTSDPVSLSLTPRLEIEQDSLYGVGGLQWQTFSVEVRGTGRNFDIQEDAFDFLDYDQQDVGLKAGWKANTHWRLIAMLLGGWTDYNEDLKNDYAYQEYAFGIEWSPSRNFGTRVDLGYRGNDYDPDSGLMPSFDQDYGDVIARVTVLWHPLENGSFTVAYDHRPEESTETNFVIADRVQASYQHKFSDRWGAMGRGGYEHSEESTDGVPAEVKEGVNAGFGVTFTPLKWLSIDVGYQYREKFTNDDSAEFIDHQATFGVTARF